MKYVLDSCVAFKWLVQEDLSDQADRLRAEFRQGVHELIAPEVFATEVTHALTRAERQNRITVAEGGRLFVDLMLNLPHLFPSLPLLPRAYAISSSAHTGVYDCLYLALAEREGCKFITSDEKLVKKLQKQFPLIVPLGSLA